MAKVVSDQHALTVAYVTSDPNEQLRLDNGNEETIKRKGDNKSLSHSLISFFDFTCILLLDRKGEASWSACRIVVVLILVV